MENWLDECRESVIHFSITKTLSKISDQEESEKLAALDEILTNRQFQVVCELLKGKSNKQIAYSLKLSEYTIENYLKKIYKIFNLHSRSALITLIKDQHYFS